MPDGSQPIPHPLDRIRSYSQRLARENDPSSVTAVNCMKGLLAGIWPMLPLVERESFMTRANVDGTFLKPSRSMEFLMGFPELYQAMKDWHRVCEGDLGEMKGFAIGIKGKMGNGWLPSDKQANLMVRLHGEWKAGLDEEPVGSLLEDDE